MGSDFLSILILPGLFELSVYANDREPARALNFRVYWFCPGPEIFELSVYAIDQEPA